MDQCSHSLGDNGSALVLEDDEKSLRCIICDKEWAVRPADSAKDGPV